MLQCIESCNFRKIPHFESNSPKVQHSQLRYLVDDIVTIRGLVNYRIAKQTVKNQHNNIVIRHQTLEEANIPQVSEIKQ